MDLSFGQAVHEKAIKLGAEGKDANQIAKIVCDQDPEGYNYGIGIMLDGSGQPMQSSPTLLEYTQAELEHSQYGNYMSSTALMADLKATVLRWQRIPETYWDHFTLALPSDAGTGAVRSAIEIALLLNPDLNTLGIEEQGWPAYRSIATVVRTGYKEFGGDGIMAEDGLLPLYQAGPMNPTGQVRRPDVIAARARTAAEHHAFVVLDRAYSGFECAGLLATQSYDEVMRMSYEQQIRPFLEHGVPFALALSPTKSFVSFALRPCGLLLLFSPDRSQEQELTRIVNIVLRARGSGFEHPITRAFVKALVNDSGRLEAEHQTALARVAEVEALWRKLAQGTSIAYQFSDEYAGLFRNPNAREDAPAHIYNEHLYPVFANNRCRQNVTGIPDDEDIAGKHVAVFAEYCY